MENKFLKNKIFKSFMKYKHINISIIAISIIICIVIFLFIDKNHYEDEDDLDLGLEENITKISQVKEKKSVNIKKPNRVENLKKALEENDETVGWVYIPGTSVDWPVMKGINNDYYLRRNEEEEYAFEGCIFGDDDSVFEPFDKLSNNIVLHGHNLDDNPDGKRFAQLVKFQDIEFAKQTPYIFLTTKDASLVYEIYAVFFTDTKFGYTKVGLDEKTQQSMIDSAKQRSEYNYDVIVSGKDKIITLSTCTYKYGPYGSVGQENTRFAIQGKLLEDGSKLKEKIELIKNPNPRQPNLK
ncbi:MAG: class B sortase [Oscillospiraceae bacterium]|nr:class B sortase [Oscillospiraceae bacterium]